MGAIMNKKMLLLAAMAIGANSVLPLAASADAMYSDIKQVIVEDALTGKTDPEKYDNTVRALDQLYYARESIKERIFSIHMKNNIEQTQIAPTFAALSGLCFVAAGYKNYTKVFGAHDLGFFGVITLGIAVLSYFNQALDLKENKNKLAEINEVITKLEAMKTELAGKLGIVEIQRV